MAFLEHAAPRLPESETVGIAGELYGLTGTARRLPGEYDDNFHLVTERGEEFTLKVMRAGLQRDLVDLQCQALVHAAERAHLLSTPCHGCASGASFFWYA